MSQLSIVFLIPLGETLQMRCRIFKKRGERKEANMYDDVMWLLCSFFLVYLAIGALNTVDSSMV